VTITPSQTAGQGGTVTFTANATTANGTLSYQWQKDGVDLAGKTAATLTLSNLSAADAAAYTCVVTNTLNGTVTTTTSTPASLSVNAGPAITTQPLDQTQPEAGSATFTVAATGSGTLTYQWTKDGAPLNGATSTTLTLTNVAAADSATYACVVTDTAAGIAAITISSPAVLTVNLKPVISGNLTNQPAVLGGPITFTVTATSNGSLSYLWQKSTDSGATWTTIPGATGASYLISSAAAGDVAAYNCIVTSTLNGTVISTTSATGNLVLNAPPVVTLAAPVGATATLDSGYVLGASPDCEFYWYKSGVQVAYKYNVTTLTGVNPAETGLYTCIIWDYKAATQPTLTVTSPKVAISVTGGVVGTPFTLSVTATGSGSLAYQWYKGTAPSGTIISGATSPSYTFTPAKTDNGANFYCMVTNTVLGTTTTGYGATASLPLNWAPAFKTIRYDATQAGTTKSLQSFNLLDSTTSPQPTGSTMTYQWFKDGVALTNGASYSGVTTSNLSVTAPATPAGQGAYTLRATNNLNGTTAMAESNADVLYVVAPPTLVSQVSNLALNQGQSGSFSFWVTAANPPATTANPLTPVLSYQWYKNGTAIAGATNPTLSFANAQTADNGSYHCIATNSVPFPAGTTVGFYTAPTLTSSTVQVRVNPVIIQPVVSMDASVLANAANQVASTQDQGPYATYTWALSAGTITGGQGTRAISYTAPASGTVTATVTVSSPLNTLSGSATAAVQAFTAPDLVAPLVVHPGDNWMKAFTSLYGGETYLWSILNNTATGAITAGAATSTASFSVDATSPDNSWLKLQVNGQQGGINATASAWVSVKTGVALTKDGGSVAPIGAYPTATTLPNGRVLITGGQIASFVSSAAAQIYDPATGRMVATGSMNTPRTKHTATLLPNGMVLVVGGQAMTQNPLSTSLTTVNLATAELWDPQTSTWTLLPTSMTLARYLHTANLLTAGPNAGKVAIIGGTGGTGAGTTIELFDPATQTWTAGPTLTTSRSEHRTVALTGAQAGRFLIVSGTNAEVYDSLTSTRVAGPTLKKSRTQASATVLSDGNVLVAGGTSTNTAEIIVPPATYTAGSFTATVYYVGSQTTPVAPNVLVGGPYATGTATSTIRATHSATLFATSPDRVLLAGGSGVFNAGAAHTAEVFTYDNSIPTAPTGTFYYAFSQPTVATSVTLAAGHKQHAAAFLPATNQVVLVGGANDAASVSTTSAVELFTPAVGTYPAAITTPATSLQTAGLAEGRAAHAATLLGDGRVLVAGGKGSPRLSYTGLDDPNSYLRSVRIYNPTTHVWTALPDMTTGRQNAQAAWIPARTGLPYGGVLVVGGKTTLVPGAGTTVAELWVPTDATLNTGAWQTVTLNRGRVFHSLVTLNDGRVLIMGGQDQTSNYTKTCEIFDSAVSTSVTTLTTDASLGGTDMTEAKVFLSPVKLADGRVAIAGGQTSATTNTSTVEVFDPATCTWTAKPIGLNTPRMSHTTTLMPNGQLLLIGGAAANGNALGFDSTSKAATAGFATEVYDFTLNGAMGGSVVDGSGKYSTALFTADGHVGGFATILANGKVLVAGGTGGLGTNGVGTSPGNVCEVYDPATGTFTAAGTLAVPRNLNLNTNNGADFTGTKLTNGDVFFFGGRYADGITQIYRPQ
jgi:hypothetical protein